MAENVIHFRGTKAGVRRLIARAVAAAAGGSDDASRAMQARIGMTALANIKRAFIVKSRGGTDECGLKWPPLAKSTVAYSRRHPGVLFPGSARAPFRPSWMLTDKERENWWKQYRVGLARFKGDKQRAARLAWSIVKAGGAKTLIGEYGNTQVDILRNLGLLLNSLSPGVSSGEHQVFKVQPGSVIVGTNRKHAGAHHKGIPGRLPQRRLWPAPSEWTPEWWGDIVDAARGGYIDILLHMLGNP